MLRLNTKLIGKLLSVQARQNNVRFSSSSSSKAKFSLVLGGGAIAVTTLTLAYAKFDKTFADQLVSYAPFVKSLLEDDHSSPKSNTFDDFGALKRKQQQPVVEKMIVPTVAKNLTSPGIVEQNQKSKTTNSIGGDKTTSSSSAKEPSKPGAAESSPKAAITGESVKLKEDELKKEVEKALAEKTSDDSKHKLEEEFRGQLKRLLYALNELYEEKRILFETENKRKQEIEMKNYLINERKEITEEYDKSFKKLKQMEKLLQIRDQLDKQEKASKKLWLLSQTLSKVMEHDRSLEAEATPIDIHDKIECIRQVVKEHFANETLIQVALNSLSEDAVKNGVFSEEDLVRRFHKVNKICQHVSLVPDEYTNIFGYIKSYAYSCIRPLFEIDLEMSANPIKVRKVPQEELEGKVEVDPKQWDSYDILQRVQICIEHRNFEMALRYANLLSGEPARVARDWIKDTREHLEVKQVLELVQTKIASMNLHQLSFSS